MMSIASEPFKAARLIQYHGSHLTTNGGIGASETEAGNPASDPNSQNPSHTIEDYYASEGQGTWFGAGAAVLGLGGQQITPEAFSALACGFKPDGTPIAQNAGDPNRAAAFECAFTGPKSFSVLWGTTTDPDIRAAMELAMDRATEVAMESLLSKLTVRTGKGGKHEKPAECIAALFTHGTNRSAEPNIHKHGVIFNVAHHGNDQWASINSHKIYDLKKLHGAMFRVVLAEELQKMGFVVERDGESFKIVDVPEKVCKAFSTPREKLLQEFRDNPDLAYTAKTAELTNYRLREKKNFELTPQELREDWRATANVLGFDADEYIRANATRERPEVVEPTPEQLLREATQMRAVIKAKDLETHIWQACQGVCGHERTKEIVQATFDYAVKVEMKGLELANEKSWRSKSKPVLYTSPDLVLIEREIAERAANGPAVGVLDSRLANAAIERFETASREKFKDPTFRLNDQQRDAVRHLTSSHSAISVLVGDAGTGKSTSLCCVADAYQREGYTVYGAALAGKIAGQLQEDVGIESRTLKRLEFDLASGKLKLDSKSVLMVDEAGMVDSRQMGRLVKACADAGARLILVGDHKQLQPVEAGATFRHIAELAGHAKLTTIIRQRDEWQRTAVRQLSQGEAGQAMRSYIDHGNVKIMATHKKALDNATAKAVANIDQVGLDKALVVASTNDVVNQLNSSIRARLIDEGKIRDIRKIEIGREKPPFTPPGETPKPFTPGPKKHIELGIGDRIVITKNDKEAKVFNGQFGVVTGFGENGQVSIKFDGAKEARAMDLTEVHLQSGFASTTHKSQGVTVERCVVFGSGNISREMSYVQASRAKGRTDFVFTTEHVKKMGDTIEPTDTLKRALSAINEARVAAGEQPLVVEKPALVILGAGGQDEAVASYSQVHKLVRENAARWAPEHIRTDLQLDRMKEIVSAMSRSQQAVSTLDTNILDAGSTGLKPAEKDLGGETQKSSQQPKGAGPVYPTPHPFPPVRISGLGIPDPMAPAQPAPAAKEREAAEVRVPVEAQEKGLVGRISETFAVARDRLLEFIEQAKQAALARNAEQEAQRARLRDGEIKPAAEKAATTPENSPTCASAQTGLRNWNAGEQAPGRNADGSTNVTPETNTGPRQLMSQRMTNPDQEPAPSSTRTRQNGPDRPR